MKNVTRFFLAHIVWPIFLAQYILAFFVYKLPGWPPLQAVGWAIWAVSLIFGVAPIFILGRRGGVAKGKSYVETTRLVDTSLYAVVRHPQYLAGILFNVAMMLMAQHGLVILLGLASAALLYSDIQDADRSGIAQFGDAYREYMRRVPQVNIPLGLYRLWRARRKPPSGAEEES
ncbi:MAG: isoprenylcysteine carboxylmethyltransferase family protein [Anaerolineales bacterium]|nr:isoprenylcysteine carboxylmethyltransferase family protein [Anaerolineales bacterium]